MRFQNFLIIILLLLLTHEVQALSKIDTIPKPPSRLKPPALIRDNTEKWYAYKDQIQELFNDFSGDIVANKVLKEKIISATIHYLKTEPPKHLSNLKIYGIAKTILSLEMNSGVLFLLRNININMNNHGVNSEFYSFSHYPIFHAILKSFKNDNEIIKKQVIGILLSGNFLESCAITQEELQFYEMFIRYLRSLKYIEVNVIPNNYNCLSENLSVVMERSHLKIELGRILNKEFK